MWKLFSDILSSRTDVCILQISLVTTPLYPSTDPYINFISSKNNASTDLHTANTWPHQDNKHFRKPKQKQRGAPFMTTDLARVVHVSRTWRIEIASKKTPVSNPEKTGWEGIGRKNSKKKKVIFCDYVNENFVLWYLYVYFIFRWLLRRGEYN